MGKCNGVRTCMSAPTIAMVVEAAVVCVCVGVAPVSSALDVVLVLVLVRVWV